MAFVMFVLIILLLNTKNFEITKLRNFLKGQCCDLWEFQENLSKSLDPKPTWAQCMRYVHICELENDIELCNISCCVERASQICLRKYIK